EQPGHLGYRGVAPHDDHVACHYVNHSQCFAPRHRRAKDVDLAQGLTEAPSRIVGCRRPAGGPGIIRASRAARLVAPRPAGARTRAATTSRLPGRDSVATIFS